MKLYCKIFALTGIVLTLFLACSKSQEKKDDGNTGSNPSYHEQATKLKTNGGKPEDYIALQKKAVKEMRQGKAKETSVNILSQMGFFYFRSGDYLQALSYLQEATDSMRNIPNDKIDIRDGIKLLGNTANLYCEMSLYDKALMLNAKAIELSRKGDNTFLPDLWRMRSVLFEKSQNLDSAVICNQIAIKSSDDLTDRKFAQICRHNNLKSYAGIFIEHPDYKPDSIAMAVRIIENIQNEYDHNDPTMKFLLGRGYVLMGSNAKGLKIMESALPVFRKNYGTDDIEWALNQYTQSLVETELSPKSLKIYKEAKRLADTVTEYSKANALLGADFKYRTTQTENERLLLEKQLELQHERTVWYVILTITTIISITSFSMMRIRRKNEIIKNSKDSINELIEERIKLNSEIEKFNQNESKKRYGVTDSNAPAYSEILNMALLTKEDDSRFRQLFDTIFPGYMQRIRRKYPDISPTAELICMLLRLNKSNEDISLALGIKRESVAKSRYRLRTLFGLDKETELNDFIAQL